MAEQPGPTEKRGFMFFYRQWLGLIVITVSVIVLGVISVFAIVDASGETREEMTRLVFAAVVPLVGTWVGTILAYNFSRENFEAAAQATKDTYAAAAGLSTETPVTEVTMSPLCIHETLTSIATRSARPLPNRISAARRLAIS